MIQAVKKRAKAKPVASGTIRAAQYLRMSTKSQEDSPERQRMEGGRIAERIGAAIVVEYSDEAKTGGESSRRGDFQQMLIDAKSGDFEMIIVWKWNRMSREDLLGAAKYAEAIRNAGVRLVTEDGEIDLNDAMGRMKLAWEAESANKFLTDTADGVISGKRRSAKLGNKHGSINYGYDKLIYDDRGQLFRRVNFREKGRKMRGWRHEYVLSEDTESVEIVRFMYDAVANQGWTRSDILKHLHKSKIKSPTGRGPWQWSTIDRILQNRMYLGTAISGLFPSGKYRQLGEIIAVENAHPAIIDQATFDLVQERLAEQDAGPRSKARRFNLLMGLLQCEHCGSYMIGHACSDGPRYRCYGGGVRETCEVKPNVPRAAELEKLVLQTVLDRLLSQANLKALHEQISRRRAAAKPNKSNDLKSLHRSIEQLQAKLVRSKENLALAKTADDFEEICQLRRAWEAEVEELRLSVRRVATRAKGTAADPQSAIARLANTESILRCADLRKVRLALRQVVDRVDIGHGIGNRPRTGERRRRGKRSSSWCGSIHFKPVDGVEIPPVYFTQADFKPMARDRVLAALDQLYRGEPVRGCEIGRAIGKSDSYAAMQLMEARSAGLVKRVGYGLWAPLSADEHEDDGKPGIDLAALNRNREKLQSMLRANPELSDTAIGRACGVTHSTVSKHRERLGVSKCVHRRPLAVSWKNGRKPIRQGKAKAL